MAEQRENQRQRTLKGGLIVFNDGRSTIECTIRNLSEGGAQLKVTSVLGIPDQFLLVLIDKSRVNCTVAWKKADVIGVKFDQS